LVVILRQVLCAEPLGTQYVPSHSAHTEFQVAQHTLRVEPLGSDSARTVGPYCSP